MHGPSTIWIPTAQMVARKPSSNNKLELPVTLALNKVTQWEHWQRYLMQQWLMMKRRNDYA
eukprot:10329364-Ditylum_brightwellii.AAC.1